MRYNSKLSNGDKAFVITFSCNGVPMIANLTVGKVIIEDTNSTGRPGEEFFDNYKPQNHYVEHYMCVETGIGSGSIYEYGKHIFNNVNDCEEAILAYLKERGLK